MVIQLFVQIEIETAKPRRAIEEETRAALKRMLADLQTRDSRVTRTEAVYIPDLFKP
jgi:hypothetical protein